MIFLKRRGKELWKKRSKDLLNQTTHKEEENDNRRGVYYG
jgi:hypothetical protein